MCDTIAATGSATITGTTLFGKNSDRDRNEAQFLDIQPRRRYGRGSVLRATYIAIPQAAETYAVLMSRPFWIWGAEMGANEHGVAIGNEAVKARMPPQRREALIGMDLLRLGLERGATAAEAVACITSLLERHGQGGNCGLRTKSFYDNSFIVADPREAYVVETVGREWAVQRIDGTRSISNTYTIGANPSALSEGFKPMARAAGWWSGRGKFDVAKIVTNEDNPSLPRARARCARSGQLLAERAGEIDALAMMAVLRDHGADGGCDDWHPEHTDGGTVCMHAGEKRGGQSVGSMVCDLREGHAVHWVTGTSAPCTSVFKPLFLDTGLPEIGPEPGGEMDTETLWWRHEKLHRALLAGDPPWPAFAKTRDALERRFAARIAEVMEAEPAIRRQVTEECWAEAAAAEAEWQLQASARNAPSTRGARYLRSWSMPELRAG